MKYNNALALYNLLKSDSIIGSIGKITFKLANTSVDISTTDTVGQSLQSWLKQYMLDKNIIFMEMDNTQEFPDFILDSLDRENNLKVQDKRGIIYNIRPCKWYGLNNRFPAFTSKEQFVKAIYDTLKKYEHSQIDADEWLSDLKNNYKKYYNKNLNI